ncbi:MAG: hypothetical protein J2P28_00235 [Actinobacteria bacterium]|nr:hypothetical protein [Actinomycetota bacterium]
MLLAATITVTVVYLTTLATDIGRHHWAHALDASREAVLVVVGWAAVIIVFSSGRDSPPAGDRGTGLLPPGDGVSPGEHHDGPDPDTESVPNTESVLVAQQRVHRLRARLAELAAARERVGSSADPDLDREVASTAARLEHARQWLTSAQSALTLTRPASHVGLAEQDRRRAERPAD